jgi:malonyl-CoA O-methyltransferase
MHRKQCRRLAKVGRKMGLEVGAICAWGAEYTEAMTQSIKWLQDEIADRMLQKLDIVKLQVKDLLLIPDFPGAHLQLLEKRFPGVRIYSVMESESAGSEALFMRISRVWRTLFKRNVQLSLEAYLKTGQIDLPDNSVDLIFSDLLMQDLADPKHFLAECWRVLREGGLLTFSYLGPDTGKELKVNQSASPIELKKLASPWDMHDMGDALLGERFADPVMDMELLHLDYESPNLLIDDAINLRLIKKPTSSVSSIGDLPKKLTLELVYGHAWAIGKRLAKAQNQVAYIDVNQIGRKTTSDSA